MPPDTPMVPDLGRADIVVCSLEPWGDVRRRIQLLVEELTKAHPEVRVLFVEPPLDVLHALVHRRWNDLGHLLTRSHAKRAGSDRAGSDNSRVEVLRTTKWLPRFVGPFADRSLVNQVRRAVRRAGMDGPILWVNDAHYARLVAQVDWPSLYDITDDWLQASLAPRERRRLEAEEAVLFERCGAVVVCSPSLAQTRGRKRPVTLIPNAVDVELFREPRPRPTDLGDGPIAMYVGTLHEDRLDVG
ncbi:MAG TPA: hypothetical protein VEJ87_08560, partial [Acidimicrobiales bacterium]|nr:hypothetical protein [Acidimicrobiales bacterium]